MRSYQKDFIEFIHTLQDKICEAFELEDGKAKFIEDKWERPGGGGGKTRIISNGGVIEKGGVNTSVVHGNLPEIMQKKLGVEHSRFFACGLSLVIHPINPFVPTVHANYRYFELFNKEGEIVDQWFGGGSDLTPYYLFDEDAIHFHQVNKNVCDEFDFDFFPKYKMACDQYFHNHHRGEARGIGGLFFDYLKTNEKHQISLFFDFVKKAGENFLDGYLPIMQKRKDIPYDSNHKNWQEIRRGRYVEFNLIHDKGTLFGLKTNGRIESILMSLPPSVRWEYNHIAETGSEEAKLIQVLKSPKNWV